MNTDPSGASPPPPPPPPPPSPLAGNVGSGLSSQLASSALMKLYSLSSKYRSFKCLTSTHFLR